MSIESKKLVLNQETLQQLTERVTAEIDDKSQIPTASRQDCTDDCL
jgi:hypothetical protein